MSPMDAGEMGRLLGEILGHGHAVAVGILIFLLIHRAVRSAPDDVEPGGWRIPLVVLFLGPRGLLIHGWVDWPLWHRTRACCAADATATTRL